MTQFEFELVAFTVDDTKIPQIHGGVAVQDLQDETCFHIRVETADRAFHERVQHWSVLHTDGDDGRLRDDDRQRDGLVPVSPATLLDGWNVDDDHRVIVFHVHTGPFLVIKWGAQVGEIDAGFHGNVGELHIGRIRKA